ncbi:hypothetical protein TNCV_1546251 [Trichonephila clavipes]|nr:hypothetical protein TNCV_1546251 [Trichonephila clavipes]
MSSPGFEPMPYGTTVSVTNPYTGWIQEQVQRRIPVSGYLIQEKALRFYKSMKQSEQSTSTSQAGKEFSASKGWLAGFLKRNALHNIKITGESVRQQMKEQQKYFQRS